MIRGKAGVDMPGLAVFVDRQARVLDGVIREQELDANRGGFRVSIGVSHQRIQPAALSGGVVIEEDQVFAGRNRGGIVAGPGKAGVGCVRHHTDPVAIGLEQVAGCIRGSIVYQDDFEVPRSGCAGKNAFHAIPRD